jgi:hypothetical protein
MKLPPNYQSVHCCKDCLNQHSHWEICTIHENGGDQITCYCAKCHRYIGRIRFHINGLEEIKNVTGYCRHCRKRMPVEDWSWEELNGGEIE